MKLYGLSQGGPDGPFREYRVMEEADADTRNHLLTLWQWHEVCTLAEALAAREMAEALRSIAEDDEDIYDAPEGGKERAIIDEMVAKARAVLDKAGHT